MRFFFTMAVPHAGQVVGAPLLIFTGLPSCLQPSFGQ